MRHDVISDVLAIITNGDNKGIHEVLVPKSKLAREILILMQKTGYIGEFEEITNSRGGCMKVKLIGKVNSCNSVRPRHAVAKNEYEKYERRYLVAKGVGFLIVSTPNGLMTHTEAKEAKTGGKLLGYVY